MHKVLIEEESFELIQLFQLIGEEAKKEKLGNAKPPINEITYWWTRKPLIVSRLVALSSTLISLEAVSSLLGLSKDRRAFNNKPDIFKYAKNLGKKPSELKILDPFAGAGNLVYEAKELGLNCTALDNSPVAYIIMRSILDYPPKYGVTLANSILEYGKELIDITKKEIGIFFNRNGKVPLTYLWVWCIRCPYCQQRVPLANNFWLSKKGNKKIGIRLILTDDLNFKTRVIENMSEKEANGFTQKGGKAICVRCRNSISNRHMASDIERNRDREMIAVVVRGTRAKEFEEPTKEDKESYINSRRYLNQFYHQYEDQGLIPHENIKASRENTLRNYGIKKWDDFFSDRQLLVMLTLLKNIKQICSEIADKEYAKIIATYLGLLLCKQVDRNSLGVGWFAGDNSINHTLAFRRPSLVYNHAEVNPFEKTSGSLPGELNDVADAIRFAAASSKNSTKVVFGSVLHLDTKVEKDFDLIITDPPYADDVQYGELSEFFYVWLYRALKDFYPELPSTAPLEEDISVSVGRFENVELANSFYEKAMKEAFKQMYKCLKDDGLLILFFAHSSTKAWNMLLEVLRESRFKVESSYAVHTESANNVIARGKTSFMSSIVVACRKVLDESSAYFEDIVPLIEEKISNLLATLTLEKLLELPMTDLLIMTYGKVLEESTKHTTLKSYRADFKPEFENIIKDAREYILKEIVKKLTGRSPNVLGSDMSFYMITKAFYSGILDSNEARKVAWAYSIDLEDLEKKYVTKKESGVTRLLFFDEIQSDKKPEEIDRNNLHQQLMYLENIADKQGVTAVPRTFSQHSNFRIQDLKDIISLLIKSYRMRINKSETLTAKEQKELKILESLSDIFNSSLSNTRAGKTLEEFMG